MQCREGAVKMTTEELAMHMLDLAHQHRNDADFAALDDKLAELYETESNFHAALECVNRILEGKFPSTAEN